MLNKLWPNKLWDMVDSLDSAYFYVLRLNNNMEMAKLIREFANKVNIMAWDLYNKHAS
jgi:predicted DNA-binding protein with PD1-like motif